MPDKKKSEPVGNDSKSGMTGKEIDVKSIELSQSQAVNIQLLRSLFRYKALRFVIYLCSASFLWAVVATILMFVSFTNTPDPQILGIDKDNRVVRLTPLDKPIFRNEVIGEKSSRYIEEIMTFDYVNYKSQLNHDGRKYMSESGFSNFVGEMNKPNGILAYVKKNSAIVTATVKGVPTMASSSRIAGRDARTFNFVMLLEFKGLAGMLTQEYSVDATILRANRMKYEDGMMLHTINMKLIGGYQ